MAKRLNQWYFATEDGAKEGPVSKETLFSLRASGRIFDSTLVWSSGMKEWNTMSAVFEEAHDLVPPPLPSAKSKNEIKQSLNESKTPEIRAISQPSVNESKKFLGGIYHPWRRYFARIVDMFTLGLATLAGCSFIIGYMFPLQAQFFVKALNNQFVAMFFLIIVWLPVEALLMSTIGTTPAKWLFGIYINTNTGAKMSFGQAFERTFIVLFQGVGMGIPVIPLITMFFAYRRLTKTGTTLWDNSVGCIVSHRKWGPLRAILCTITVFFIIILLGLLNSIIKQEHI